MSVVETVTASCGVLAEQMIFTTNGREPAIHRRQYRRFFGGCHEIGYCSHQATGWTMCEALSTIGVQRSGERSQSSGAEGPYELYRGAEYVVDFYPRSRSTLLSLTAWLIRPSRPFQGRANRQDRGRQDICLFLEHVTASEPARPAKKRF